MEEELFCCLVVCPGHGGWGQLMDGLQGFWGRGPVQKVVQGLGEKLASRGGLLPGLGFWHSQQHSLSPEPSP